MINTAFLSIFLISISAFGFADGPNVTNQKEKEIVLSCNWKLEETNISIPIKPLGDRIIIKVMTDEKKTAGGIIIPNTDEKERPKTGEVLACGPGKRDQAGKYIPIDLNVGDVVLFGKYSGTEVMLSGDDYLIISEKDVFAIID